MWRRLGTSTLTLGGRTFAVWDYLPNVLPTRSRHEGWLDDVFRCVFDLREGVFFDVGMNRGQTLLKVLRIDPGRRYVGFEPQPGPSFVVDQFVTENALATHTVVPVGLSDRWGLVPVQVRGGGYHALFSSGASTVAGFRPAGFYDAERWVPVAPGDEVVARLDVDALALIKIDVEGGELEVVEGLAGTIERHQPYVLFEVLHNYLVTTSEALDADTVAFREDRLARLEAALRSRGYGIYQIRGGEEVREVDRIRPEAIDDLSSTDYLAVPTDDDARFRTRMGAARRVVPAGA